MVRILTYELGNQAADLFDQVGSGGLLEGTNLTLGQAGQLLQSANDVVAGLREQVARTHEASPKLKALQSALDLFAVDLKTYLAGGNSSTLLQTLGQDARNVRRALDAYSPQLVVQARLNFARATAIGDLKLGSFFEPGATFGFANVSLSSEEEFLSVRDNVRASGFIGGTFLGPLGTTSAESKGRVAAGLLAGDPDEYVATLSLGSYFSPGVTDLEGSLTYRAITGPTSKASEAPFSKDFSWRARTWALNRESHLIDHVRSGDIWLAGSVRNLSSSSESPSGTAYQGAIVFALPEKFGHDTTKNPTVSTTLSFSATSCKEHSLGLDEYGFELRLPIRGSGVATTPLYLSGRYGTRGDETVGIELRF